MALGIGSAVAIGLGSQAAATLASIYQQNKANKASKAKLKEIGELYDSVVPPDYDLSITDPPELIAQEIQKPKYRKWLARTRFNPEQIKKMGTYAPEVAKLIREDAPELIKETHTTRRGRRAQESALEGFDRVAKSRDDPEFRLLVDRAKRRAQSEAQSRGKTIQSQMARRGMSGSGLELAAQMGASATAMDRMAQVEQEAAANAYRNRLEALARGADLGGRMRREDQDVQSRNNALINSFNQRMSARRQDLEMKRVDDRNRAQEMNLGERQRLHELNRSREDRIAREHRAQDERGLAREDRLKDTDYRRRAMERDHQNKLRMYNAEWAERQRNRRDDLTNRMHRDRMEITHGKAGRMDAARRDDLDAADRRSARYFGSADAVSDGVGLYYGAQQDAAERAAKEADREAERQWREKMLAKGKKGG